AARRSRRAISSRNIESYSRRGRGQRRSHRKCESRRAAVTFVCRHIVDAERRTIIVQDRSYAVCLRNARAIHVRDVHKESLVWFDLLVAIYCHCEVVSALTGGNHLARQA